MISVFFPTSQTSTQYIFIFKYTQITNKLLNSFGFNIQRQHTGSDQSTRKGEQWSHVVAVNLHVNSTCDTM